MKTIKLLLILSISGYLWGCQPEQASPFKFDSAHNVAVTATIDVAKMLSQTDNVQVISDEIKQQLKYAIGQLNGIYGGVAQKVDDIAIIAVNPLREGFQVEYSATLTLSWPREKRLPRVYNLILPEGGSFDYRQDFFDQYGPKGPNGKACVDSHATSVGASYFWYYYRPLNRGCPLAARRLPIGVESVPAQLSLSDTNTSGKSPEYGKIWEDGQLVVTAVFGKATHGSQSDSDAGVTSYRQFYDQLRGTFGVPLSTSLPVGVRPGINRPSFHATFSTPHGVLDVDATLIESPREVDIEFIQKFEQRTLLSDFVSYSGHSGLGKNIRAFTQMGKFRQDQYQVYLINGCDSYSYVDKTLLDSHAQVNPGFLPSKHLEIVTNAMPSYFHSNSRSNMELIKGFVGKTKTYREILFGFDRAQRAAVVGEEDNLWPRAFNEE